MKYYVEEETRELRKTLEAEVLSWPKVTHRKMWAAPATSPEGRCLRGS